MVINRGKRSVDDEPHAREHGSKLKGVSELNRVMKCGGGKGSYELY
jgi:hypothetical protein